MDLQRCIRSDRFALFIGLCGVISLFYIAIFSDHFNLGERFAFVKIRHLENKTSEKKTITAKRPRFFSTSLNSTKNNKTLVALTLNSPSAKSDKLTKPEKLQSGEELLSLRSKKKYPSFVDLDVLKTLSLKELKEKSYNFSFQNPSIVRVIHQSWKVKTLPPRFLKWSMSWRENFPDYEYKLWTDADNHNFVKNYFPWFWKRYDRLTRPVQKADAVRYLYLFAQGGIYADLDDECLKNFEHLLKNCSVIFGAMAGSYFAPNHPAHLKEGYVQNSFMYSVPGHPLWLEVIDTILKRPNSGSAESTTGPFMLQEVIAKWRKTFPRRQHEICIYEPVYFNPFSWLTSNYADCKDVNRMTSKDIKACKAHFTKSYVIQYHTQTWGRGAINTNRNDRR